jgi:hypothetical protein
MMLSISFSLADAGGVAHSLTLQEVLMQMDQHDRMRIASLKRYTCTRRYALENHRFHLAAEVRVRMTYTYPGHKTFEVLEEHGSSVVRQRVLRRMLEAEAEASNDNVRERTRIIARNYEFQLLGVEVRQGRPAYVLKATPRASDKFSFRGKVWVDSEDFAIVRVDAVPAQSPSSLIRNTHIIQQYQKLGTLWLPLFNHADSDSFWFGRTEVTIDSGDYEVMQNPAVPASPVSAALEVLLAQSH